MTTRPPMERFLGLPSDADPIEVLGLAPSELSAEAVVRALTARLAMVAEHPDGDSDDGRAIQQHLRDAAAALADPASRRRIMARHIPADLRLDRVTVGEGGVTMTPFDRQVLGVLVANGGWNHRSRARLMALAAAHRLPPEELMKVLTGMANWLGGDASRRSGSPGDPAPSGPPPSVISPGTEAFDRFVDRWTPVLRRGDRASVTQLAVIFSSTALLLIAVIVGVVVSTPERPISDSPWVANSSESIPERAGSGTTEAGIPPQGRGTEDDSEIIRIPPLPPPADLQDAADAISGTTMGLRLVADEIAGGGALDQSLQRYTRLVDEAARGWMLSSGESRSALREAMVRLVIAMGSDSGAAAPFLDVLVPAGPGRVDLDQITTASWKSGILGLLAADERISPGLREAAQSRLSIPLQGETAGGFALGASGWLKLRLVRLIEEVEISPLAEAAWALWQASVGALEDSAQSQEMLLDAAEALLRRGLMVGRDGPTRRVLGRLLRDLAYAESAAVRDRILGLYLDTELSSTRLAELTRLLASLAATPWFDERSRVDPLATSAQRRRQHDGLAARWPRPRAEQLARLQPIPAGFDPALASVWESIHQSLAARPWPRTDRERVSRLLRLRQLNEAATALTLGEAAAASGLLRALEQDGDGSEGWRQRPAAAGGAGSTLAPGWARRMSKAAGNDRKLEVLEELGRVQVGDLTARDAAMLASLAFQAPLRIKQRAWSLIERRLADDPEVILALLDALPDRPSTFVVESLAVILDADLPSGATTSLRTTLQRRLVEYALLLRASTAGVFEDLLEDYAQSILQERLLLAPQEVVNPVVSDPGEELRHLHRIRQERLRGLLEATFEPELAALQRQQASRERLAADGLQMALVHLMGLMDLVAAEWSWRLPDETSRLELVVDDTVAGLAAEATIVDQLVRMEQSIAEIWGIVIEAYQQRVAVEWKERES